VWDRKISYLGATPRRRPTVEPSGRRGRAFRTAGGRKGTSGAWPLKKESTWRKKEDITYQTFRLVAYPPSLLPIVPSHSHGMSRQHHRLKADTRAGQNASTAEEGPVKPGRDALSSL